LRKLIGFLRFITPKIEMNLILSISGGRRTIFNFKTIEEKEYEEQN